MTVSNSTISGNSADYGGGISNGSSVGSIFSRLTVSNSTISDNSASVSGGGIYNSGGGGDAGLQLGSTILNAGSSGENIFNAGATVTSHGYNLSSDNGGGYLTAPATRSIRIRCSVPYRTTVAQLHARAVARQPGY